MNIESILSGTSLGWRKVAPSFGARSNQISGFHDNRLLPLDYNGKNLVSTLAQPLLIGSSSLFAGNKKNYNSLDGFETRQDQNQGLLSKLPLNVWYNLNGLIMAEVLWALYCVHFWMYLIVLAGNKDNHNSLDEFKFLSDHITNFSVSCHWAPEKRI